MLMHEDKDASMYKGLLQSSCFRVREAPTNSAGDHNMHLRSSYWSLGEILTPTTQTKFFYTVIIFSFLFSLSLSIRRSASIPNPPKLSATVGHEDKRNFRHDIPIGHFHICS